MTALAPLVTAFFRHHLAGEKGVSKHTLAGYSYAFKFLCGYVSGRLGKPPSALALEELDAPMVRDFLAHQERDGRNTARTRNLRLTAIRSFMKYVEYEVPSALEQVRRVRAIPSKRTAERLIDHLTKAEMKALLDGPDPRTRSGRRDQAMLYLGFAAGLRVSELVGLRLGDLENRRGEALTRDGFTYLVKKYVGLAMPQSPGLAQKRVSPHVLRHTCAMNSLQATRDIRKVALWLGHTSLKSTEIYLRADPSESWTSSNGPCRRISDAASSRSRTASSPGCPARSYQECIPGQSPQLTGSRHRTRHSVPLQTTRAIAISR
jgi:site-specific recombinase XerD